MIRTCRTFRTKKSVNEKSYECISCICHLHFNPECTSLSNVALNGIRELGINVMLLCKTCSDNIKHDSLIRRKTVAEVEKLNFAKKVQKIEAEITKLVDMKVVEPLKLT